MIHIAAMVAGCAWIQLMIMDRKFDSSVIGAGRHPDGNWPVVATAAAD